MTTPLLTTNDLFEALEAQLKLKWVAGSSGKERLLEPSTARFPGMALVGHLNFVHPNRVQVVGEAEIQYLQRLDKKERQKEVHDLFASKRTAVVVVANKMPATSDLVQEAERAKLALFTSPLPSPVVIDHMQYYLTRALALRTTVHGVYMEVMGTGVLITGESGIGKSELALELLSRGHRLIADDAVELIRVGPDVLVGQCPRGLSDYLEVRGLGILDVRMMFGETAVRHKKKLHLVVHLEQIEPRRMSQIDRLQAQMKTRAILDVEVPTVILYVGPGRNLAVLVEAATRSYILRTWGINQVEEFMKRHQELIHSNSMETKPAARPRRRRGAEKRQRRNHR